MQKLTLHTFYYKIKFFANQENRTHRYMLERIPWSTILNIASIQFSSTHFNERQDVGGQVMRAVHYAHFVLNKLESPSLRL